MLTTELLLLADIKARLHSDTILVYSELYLIDLREKIMG